MFFLLPGCFLSNASTPAGDAENKITPVLTEDIPITIVSLEDKILKFDCVNDAECPEDVNLDNQFLDDSFLEINRALLGGPDSIFLIITSKNNTSEEKVLFHLNPKFGEVNSIMLPGAIKHPDVILADGRLVLVEENKTEVIVFEEDLSMSTIDVKMKVDSLIGTNSQRIVALNKSLVRTGSEYFIEISVIDLASKQSVIRQIKLTNLIPLQGQKQLESDQVYLGFIEGVSPDLKTLYCLFVRGNAPNLNRLGVFELEGFKELASTDDPRAIQLFGYAQYHNMLFTSDSGGESGVGASLINMSAAKSLLDDKWLPKSMDEMLYVVPFGEMMLLGTNSEILKISPEGEVLNTYQLPPEWINRSYKIIPFYR